MDARNRELDTERHFKLLAERESGRLRQDLVRMEKNVRELTDQVGYFLLLFLGLFLDIFFTGICVLRAWLI